MQNPNAMVKCPYDPDHRVLAKRLQYHIIKCREKYRHLNFVTCPYNAKHINRPEDHILHLQHCWDRQNVDQDLFCKDDEILVRPLICGSVKVPEYRESRNTDFHWDTEHLPPRVVTDETMKNTTFCVSKSESSLAQSVRLPTSEPKLLPPRKTKFQMLTDCDGSSEDFEFSEHSSASHSPLHSPERGINAVSHFSRDIYNGSQSSLGSNVSNQSSYVSALINQSRSGSDSSSQSLSVLSSNCNQPLCSPSCTGDAASTKFFADSRVLTTEPNSDSFSLDISSSAVDSISTVPKISRATIRLPVTEPKILSDLASNVSDGNSSTPVSGDVQMSEPAGTVFLSNIPKPQALTAFRPVDLLQTSSICLTEPSTSSRVLKTHAELVRLPSTEPKVLTKPKPALSSAHRSCLPFLSVFKYSNTQCEEQIAAPSEVVGAVKPVVASMHEDGRDLFLLEQNSVQDVGHVGVVDVQHPPTSPYFSIGRGIGRGFFGAAGNFLPQIGRIDNLVLRDVCSLNVESLSLELSEDVPSFSRHDHTEKCSASHLYGAPSSDQSALRAENDYLRISFGPADKVEPVAEQRTELGCGHSVTESLVHPLVKPTLSSNHRSCLPFLSDFKYSSHERKLSTVVDTKSNNSPVFGMSMGAGRGLNFSEHNFSERSARVGMASVDSHSSDLSIPSFGRGRFAGIGRGLIFGVI